MNEPSTEVWVVYSHQRGGYFRPACRGYTTSVWEAGRFPRERAEALAADGNIGAWDHGVPNNVAVLAPECATESVTFQEIPEVMRGRIRQAAMALQDQRADVGEDPGEAPGDDDRPWLPRAMSASELAAMLRELATLVERGESFEGSLTYLVSTRAEGEFDVAGLYRYGCATGPRAGHGSVRILREFSEPGVVCDEGALVLHALGHHDTGADRSGAGSFAPGSGRNGGAR